MPGGDCQSINYFTQVVVFIGKGSKSFLEQFYLMIYNLIKKIRGTPSNIL